MLRPRQQEILQTLFESGAIPRSPRLPWWRKWWHARFGHQRHVWGDYCTCGEVNLWPFAKYQERQLRELRRRIKGGFRARG